MDDLSSKLSTVGGKKLLLRVSREEGNVHNIGLMRDENWIAQGYGMRVSAPVIVVSWEAIGPLVLQVRICEDS
jgi:hypothetical protein